MVVAIVSEQDVPAGSMNMPMSPGCVNAMLATSIRQKVSSSTFFMETSLKVF
jgi:hypothetical protein